MAPLPFLPEDFLTLQARLPDALQPVIDCVAVATDQQQRPGQSRQHVLDTQEGFRLIVSRDRLIDKRIVCHLSASLAVKPRDVPWLRTCRTQQQVLQTFVAHVEQIWQHLGGPPVTLKLCSLGEGVPHWYGPPQEEKTA